MNRKRIQELGVAVITTALMVGLVVLVQNLSLAARNSIPELEPIAIFPDFAYITDLDVKKQQFFDYLQDYVEAENAAITELRSRVEGLAALHNQGLPLSAADLAWLEQLAQTYGVDTEGISEQQLFRRLLRRVDVLPVSLALAQAANESAWGTSRFALEGNNLFGQWCYEEGCGIVPLRRRQGANHEVRYFDSLADAVSGYFMNINTHPSYSYLRELREDMRRRDVELDPVQLASGLGRYSERGDHYVDEVQTIIRQNDLRQRDNG